MTTPKQVRNFAKKLEAVKKKAATVRDELRDLIGEANEIAENFDSAEVSLGSAISELEEAADEMSKYV